MEITNVTIKIAHIDLTVTLPNGEPAAASDLRFGLCGHDGPDDSTRWVTARSYDPPVPPATIGEATVLIVGSSVPTPPGEALVAPPGGAELWGRNVENPEDDPGFIDMVEVR